jgi:hypothetical protein
MPELPKLPKIAEVENQERRRQIKATAEGGCATHH